MFDISAFMPHGHCYLWRPGILWTHVISDLIVGLAYLSIPLALLYYKVKARHTGKLLDAVLWMFMSFIILCGTTHLVQIWTVWEPVYQLEAIIKAMTALVSIAVAITLWPLMPKVLAIPSPAELKSANDELDQLNANLAQRVDFATAELRRQAESLEQSNTELRRSNEDLDNFAHVASHDLRSPLRGIDNLAQWISEDYAEQLSDDAMRDFGMLRGRIRRMESLLEGLLAYSRVGREEQPLDSVNLQEVVDEIADMLDKPEAFEIVTRGELPVVYTHAVPLKTVIRNLIGNSIKHRNREDGRVEVACDEYEDHYRLSVSDDGPGIAPEHREKVFGLFKVLRPRDEVEGSGIGLALVKRTVESVGGHIEIDDNEGRAGVRFVFTWPKHTEAEK